jgi:demethylmenaquinone methyltransferase/2-methoxy-6-polyprenyl-1,4-benzoquinol methylase
MAQVYQRSDKEAKETYIQTIFTSIAKRYDLLNSLLSLSLDRSWRKFAVKVSQLKANDRVLDVCTGTGELALAYFKALSKGGRRKAKGENNIDDVGNVGNFFPQVIGTDFCAKMLEVGRQKLKKQGISEAQVRLTEADTLNLPFSDNSFDVVAVGFGIRNVSDLKGGILEMARVAAPGGRVVILEFTQPPNRLFRSLYYIYFTKLLPVIGKVISGDKYEAYSYLPESVLSFPDIYGLKKIMGECGLTDVKIYLKTFGIVSIHVGRKS